MNKRSSNTSAADSRSISLILLILLAAVGLDTPAGALEPPPITPVEEFFVLGNAPEIPEDWRLAVDGDVDNPLSLSLEDIKAYPATTEMSTLECWFEVGEDPFEAAADLPQGKVGAASGISRRGWLLVSNANWTGVRLNDILADAEPHSTADTAKFTAIDGYETEILLDELTERDDILLAYAMNDQALPLIQGYPLKLVLPGCGGYQNARWLQRITLKSDLGGSPLSHFPVHTRILEPKRLTTIPLGTYTIRGMAFVGQGREIAKVDISTDYGQTWRSAELLNYHLPNVWKHWQADWIIPDVGSYKIFARAEDVLGNVQIDGPGNFGWKGFGVPVKVDYDLDGDTVADSVDNCPAIFNPSQIDSDGDGVGNSCDQNCPNLDGLNPVNIADFSLLGADWGRTGEDILGDLNADNIVDANDLATLAAHWLSDC